MWCSALLASLTSPLAAPGETPLAARAPAALEAPFAGPGAPQRDGQKDGDDENGEDDDPERDHSVTSHSVAIGGRELAYTVRAGRMKLEDESGKDKAEIFFVAYTADEAVDPAKRPITFSFNGGPGSSSVWLHLGALGPRRVRMHPEGWAPPPPYEVADNPQSWLDLTDLVFIDPVTTGYSRAAADEDAAQFHGVTGDVEWIGEFIRLYTTRYLRWASPKFLAGESYGTTRAAALSGHLQGRHGMYLNGVVLVSAILDFQTARFDRGNDLPYALFLPTYAATARYHGRVDLERRGELRAFLAEVEHFAIHEYVPALAQGDALPPQRRADLVARLAGYTGLSPEWIERADLRIDIGRFTKELLRADERTVGRLDSRFTGIDRDATADRTEYDPSYAAIQGPFTAALNDYVRRELGYENDLPYEILTGRVQPWRYDQQNRYLAVGETLRQAMTHNPALRVFVAAGFYDLATPYFAAEHTLDHLGLDPTLRDHVTLAHYEAGHMMYVAESELAKLKRDVAAFYGAALAR